MDFSSIGPWAAGILAVPWIVRGFIAWMALRGTKPRERPEILRALTSFTLFRDRSQASSLPAESEPDTK